MARTQIPVLVALANQADGLELTASAVAVDAPNGMYFVNRGGRTLVIFNVPAASGVDVTILSVADPYGRTQDLGPTSLGAGELDVLGPFTPLLFNLKDGTDQVLINLASVTGSPVVVGLQYPAV